MTSFMLVFNTNKVPRVVLVFLLVGTHLAIKRESPGHTGQARPNQQVRPALHPATFRVQATITSTNTLWMDRIRRGYVGLIQRVWKESLGSTGPLLHAPNRHSEAILSIPYQWRCITRLWVDTAGSRDTAAPTKRQIRQNRPRIPTHNWPRSEHQHRPWRMAANQVRPHLEVRLRQAPAASTLRWPPTAIKRTLHSLEHKTHRKSFTIVHFCILE
jgi:hypothetical protein